VPHEDAHDLRPRVPGTTAPAPAAESATSLAVAADQFVTLNDVRLRYHVIGRGEPVVLLHGYLGRLEAMSSLADSLAHNFRVIVPDERGFGQSTKFADPARFGRVMSDDVIGLLDHLGIRRAHLVGHSMGALVAASAAVRQPSRIASVSLVAGPFYADSAAFAQQTAPYVTDLERGKGLTAFFVWIFPGMPDSVAAGLNAQLIPQNDMGSLIASLRAMGGLAVTRDRGSRASVPALVVVGTGDPLLPQSRDIAGWWPGARLVEIPGVNHLDIISRNELIGTIRSLVSR